MFRMTNNRPIYIALHGADSKVILEHLERICKVAAKIIEDIEKIDLVTAA